MSSFGIMFLWCSLSWLLGFYQQRKIQMRCQTFYNNGENCLKQILKGTKILKSERQNHLTDTACETELQLTFHFSALVISWLVSGLTDQLFDLYNIRKWWKCYLHVPKSQDDNLKYPQCKDNQFTVIEEETHQKIITWCWNQRTLTLSLFFFELISWIDLCRSIAKHSQTTCHWCAASVFQKFLTSSSAAGVLVMSGEKSCLTVATSL